MVYRNIVLKFITGAQFCKDLRSLRTKIERGRIHQISILPSKAILDQEEDASKFFITIELNSKMKKNKLKLIIRICDFYLLGFFTPTRLFKFARDEKDTGHDFLPELLEETQRDHMNEMGVARLDEAIDVIFDQSNKYIPAQASIRDQREKGKMMKEIINQISKCVMKFVTMVPEATRFSLIEELLNNGIFYRHVEIQEVVIMWSQLGEIVQGEDLVPEKAITYKTDIEGEVKIVQSIAQIAALLRLVMEKKVSSDSSTRIGFMYASSSSNPCLHHSLLVGLGSDFSRDMI
ncbi:hypothetical protein ACFE04_009366 [Oxalis oulophora]